MSSDTSYWPTLRGSCGGGYEGGVHLFTPRKTGAKKKRTEEGGGGARQCKQKRKKKDITGKNVSNASDRDTTQHEIMLPLKTANDAQDELLVSTFLHNPPEL